ncbi:MAG: hypothetical protein ACSHX3_02565 [Litorimonas sp.]
MSNDKIEIKNCKPGQETDQALTEGLTKTDDDDADAESLDGCTNGHIRRKTKNGKTYCQMCCGGSWKYFCWDSGRCVQPSDDPVTVNCGGKKWILDC